MGKQRLDIDEHDDYSDIKKDKRNNAFHNAVSRTIKSITESL